MQALAGVAALILTGVGFALGGLLGALTGVVVTIAVGSGLAIAGAEAGTGTAPPGRSRMIQRVGGLAAAVLSLGGAVVGGWRWGWAWALGGYLVAMMLVAIVGSLTGRLSEADQA